MPADAIHQHTVEYLSDVPRSVTARRSDSDDPADHDHDHDHDQRGSGDEGDESAPVPFAPDEDDDSSLGDTDQHSDA